MEQLIAQFGLKLSLFLVDAATYMDRFGRFRPGNRGLAQRHGMSKSTINRRIAKAVRLGLISKIDCGGSATCRYRVLDPALRKTLEHARDILHPGWREMYWRKPCSAKVAQAWLSPLGEPVHQPESGTRGNPYSPNQSPASCSTEPRARALDAPSAPAEARPVAQAPAHPEASSSAQTHTPTAGSTVKRVEGADGSASPRLLPSRKAAAGPKSGQALPELLHNPGALGRTSGVNQTAAKRTQKLGSPDIVNPVDKEITNQLVQSGHRRRTVQLVQQLGHPLCNRIGCLVNEPFNQILGLFSHQPPPKGPPLKAYVDKTWRENLDLFIGEYGTWDDQLASWRNDSKTIARFDRWRLAINWKPPPEIRARHKFHARSSGVANEERDRRKQLRMMKVASWLNPADRPAFWQAMIDGNWEVFDKLDAAMRRSGWEKRSNIGPGNGRFYGRLGVEGRKVTADDPSDSVSPAPRAKIRGESYGPFFHNRSYATHFEALNKSSYSATSSPVDDSVRTLTNEALTWSANTSDGDRYETRERVHARAQTGVRTERAPSDRGSDRRPGETWSQAWLPDRGAPAQPPQGEGLSRRGLVGNDRAPRAPGPAGLGFAAAPPPGGGGGGGRTFDPRICENSQNGPPKIKISASRRPKFTQIEGLPPSTFLVPR